MPDWLENLLAGLLNTAAPQISELGAEAASDAVVKIIQKAKDTPGPLDDAGVDLLKETLIKIGDKLEALP